MDASGAGGKSARTRTWVGRAVQIVALAVTVVGVVASRHVALALLLGSGTAVLAAAATLPRRDKPRFAEDLLLGIPAGLAFGFTFLGLSLAAGELRLSRASTALLPFLAACLVLALLGLLRPVIRRRLEAEQALPETGGFLGLAIGMVFGAGLAFLTIGYLGLPVHLL